MDKKKIAVIGSGISGLSASFFYQRNLKYIYLKKIKF